MLKANVFIMHCHATNHKTAAQQTSFISQFLQVRNLGVAKLGESISTLSLEAARKVLPGHNNPQGQLGKIAFKFTEGLFIINFSDSWVKISVQEQMNLSICFNSLKWQLIFF